MTIIYAAWAQTDYDQFIKLDWHAEGQTKLQFLSTTFLKPTVSFSSLPLSGIPRQLPQLFAYIQVL